MVGPLCTGGTPKGHGTAGVNSQAAFSGHIIPVAAYDPRNITSKANRSRVEPGRPAPTLHSSGLAVAFNHNATAHASGDVSPTLRAGSGCGSAHPAVLAYGGNQTSGPRGQASCLSAKGGTGRMDFETETFLTGPAGGVRRLTPRECERLMGWPDDFTRWTDDGREVKDGPRYRLCGNGVVANVAEWIGRRLMEFA